ncbi:MULTISPECIES: 2TM domain-containing protein [Flavobacteriaceae]|uniref:2TM domain-containing protein n=1 Tax=Flavobacteriaceae TaxID=49546 RepID=UPI00234BDDFF|nr:2TM domain-containing protein [Muricauda sp. SP22]MDC6362960.1 2TM domain-containing protein [Muricauda sp. SP22]
MENLESKYDRAYKRVKEIKDFYRHVMIFIVVNGTLYLIKTGILLPLLPDGVRVELQYFDWVHVNFIIWALILLVHVVYLFRYRIEFLRTWEERQIKKIMEREASEIDKYL